MIFGRKKHSKNGIEKIAEEFAEIYKKMNWTWANPYIESPIINITPTKELIAKNIQEKIKRLVKSDLNGAYISSGRIFVMKSFEQNHFGKYTEYNISLNDREIRESELEEEYRQQPELKEKRTKLDWGNSGSMRVPVSVLKQLDEYKRKHGYTSRPQAIISAIERAEKVDLIDDIRRTLKNSLRS